jgi:predicted nucleic acid-binding protein
MSESAFVDTNIFVYAHLYEESNPKCEAALALLWLTDKTWIINP